MSYPPPENISADEFPAVLARLKHLLENLPTQLPSKNDVNSIYALFLDFSLDPELMERTGCEVSTLSEQLKRVFGWAARTTGDGIIPIVERGAAICALHDVFSAFFTKYPDNNVLKKWIIDVMVIPKTGMDKMLRGATGKEGMGGWHQSWSHLGKHASKSMTTSTSILGR
jgi:hypothetical protein